MTDEEKQELEALRREKREQVQRERAAAVLEAAGIPVSFAPLLAGENDAGTDARAEAFRNVYHDVLEEEIRRRLPQEPPAMTPPTPRRAERGVRRIR